MKCSPQKEVKGYHNCSSNFLSHLKRKHGEDCIEEYKNYVKKKKTEKRNNETSSGRVSTTVKVKKQTVTLTQEQFDENIVKYFIHSMISLRAIEDPYFLNIFKDLNLSNIGLKIMSRRTLGRRIKNYYTSEIANIKSILHETDYVCTTVDIWSGRKRSFIGVTAHWITKDLCRMSIALACRRFRGTHSYDRISELVQEINSEFNLTVNKIVATVTDNGSNFVKAFKMFGVKLTNIKMVDDCDEDGLDAILSDSEDFEEEENADSSIVDDSDLYTVENYLLPSHLRCCAHTLSLCATTDANKVLNIQNTQLSNIHNCVMKKCNALWKAVGRPKSAEIVQNVLEHSLSRPGQTRWNSLFDSLQQIFSIKENNLNLHKALNIKNPIKDNEFDYIQEYLMCTTPVAEALNIMQSENNTYYGIVLPCLFALRRKLKKIEKKKLTYCKSLIETYIESVERRFNQFYNLTTPESKNAAIAAMSYPRFKNKWLSCVESIKRNEVINMFKTIISKEIHEKPETAVTHATKNTKKENKFFIFDSDSDSEMQSNRSSGFPQTKAELLMLHFFAEESQELEILNRYLEIKNVFIKYNTALPSSAPVERLFSYATMTDLPKSHKLSDQMFEKRVILKANLNYKKH
ncbi:PREDICTED: uncharacterized protein LOC105565991 [Vollenhovia emeryi]|uniref:uncharacterized protein LOC105565991 n=1 Tax=Vollenhovia emeryi TaxID=411798 RepID=UPI0005F43301|nr:PREDICTED: uncharacterized protein LOC105565991 [Vollenhovia emeryi]